MGPMQITGRNDFAADPTTVYEMFVDESFLTAVCQASEAVSHDVTIAGPTTRTVRELPTPDAAAKFAGSTLKVQEDVAWGEPAADGSRDGEITVTIPGLPVQMTGTARLAPGGRGTVIDYLGDLVVNLPFIGKKMEQAAAPALTEAIDLQQSVGDDWLASRAG